MVYRNILARVERAFKSAFFMPDVERRFISHNRKVWGEWRVRRPISEILVDPFAASDWIVSVSYFSNVLAKKHNAEIKAFYRHWYSIYSDLLRQKIRSSFNCRSSVIVSLSRQQQRVVGELLGAAKDEIKTKQDVFDYKELGVWIGIDIYETYLRAGRPTVDLGDDRFWDTVRDGLELLVFWRDYFDSGKVAAVIVSHDCYNSLDILAKVAYEYNVPVYLPNPRGLYRSFEPLTLYAETFRSFRSAFGRFDQDAKTRALQWSAGQLERRLGGEVGVDMHYSTASAFHSEESDRPVLRKSDRIKVIVYTHCFFDNPHAYGGLLFLDFYEWLTFLGGIAEETDYDWYVKPHPDFLPGTVETLNKILAEHPRLALVPPETSHHQLASEGISFAFTCYGSVGHELPLLGGQVINAGYNPHIAYDFNWHPKSIDEYALMIKNLDKLEKKAVSYDDVCEFYYMNYKYTYLDSLVYDSHRKMLRELGRFKFDGGAPFTYFLDGFSETKHEEIIGNMSRFIESGRSSYCIDDLEAVS